jgi:hypothetical protein
MRLSVLITHLKRKLVGPRKVLITLKKVLITPKSQRRCIISLNFMSTFDMIMVQARRKMVFQAVRNLCCLCLIV